MKTSELFMEGQRALRHAPVIPGDDLQSQLAEAVRLLGPFAAVGTTDTSPDYLRLIDVNGTLHVKGSTELTIGHCRAAAAFVRENQAK